MNKISTRVFQKCHGQSNKATHKQVQLLESHKFLPRFSEGIYFMGIYERFILRLLNSRDEFMFLKIRQGFASYRRFFCPWQCCFEYSWGINECQCFQHLTVLNELILKWNLHWFNKMARGRLMTNHCSWWSHRPIDQRQNFATRILILLKYSTLLKITMNSQFASFTTMQVTRYSLNYYYWIEGNNNQRS